MKNQNHTTTMPRNIYSKTKRTPMVIPIVNEI